MPPELLAEDDYASEEDSDFAPDDAPGQASSGESGDEDEADAGGQAAAKRKRATQEGSGNDVIDIDNSGDEAVIEKAKKRRKKTKGKNNGVEDDDGEGIVIKTRSQRAQEKAERKATASSGPVTIDVDALWAQMTADPRLSSNATGQEHTDAAKDTFATPADSLAPAGRDSHDNRADNSGDKDMIKIKRTYNFAGKVHTEEKLVAKDSAEAKLYLESLGENGAAAAAAQAEGGGDSEPKRMPRRAFRSAYEPVIDQSLQRADLNLGMSVRLRARELAKENAKKLNTVEKSRMDWAGFVDKEGIKDELALAGKSKGSFAERQQFLARSEAKREEEARRARLAGLA